MSIFYTAPTLVRSLMRDGDEVCMMFFKPAPSNVNKPLMLDGIVFKTPTMLKSVNLVVLNGGKNYSLF